jgi:hypothetical protein
MGMLAAALPVSAATDRTRLINAIVERFCAARPGRSLFFDPADEGPSGPALLAAELVAEAERRFAVIPGPGLAADFVRFARERDRTLADLALPLMEGHAVPTRSGDPGLAILGRGWSAPEAWGTWSTSTCAEIRLPALAGDGAWGVLLRGTPFSGGLEASGRRRIVAIAGRGVVEHEYGPGDHVMTLSIRLEASEVLAGARIELRFPDAVAPASLGLSNDTRLLGLGLMSIAVAPAVAAPASTRATASCRTSDSESRSTASRTP